LDESKKEEWKAVKIGFDEKDKTIGEIWQLTENCMALVLKHRAEKKEKIIKEFKKELFSDDPLVSKIKEEWANIPTSAELACVLGKNIEDKKDEDVSIQRDIIFYYYCLGKLDINDMMLLLYYIAIKAYFKIYQMSTRISTSSLGDIFSSLILRLVQMNKFISILLTALINEFIQKIFPQEADANITFEQFRESFLEYVSKLKKGNPGIFERQYKLISRLFDEKIK
jgi:hypothetical protein